MTRPRAALAALVLATSVLAIGVSPALGASDNSQGKSGEVHSSKAGGKTGDASQGAPEANSTTTVVTSDISTSSAGSNSNGNASSKGAESSSKSNSNSKKSSNTTSTSSSSGQGTGSSAASANDTKPTHGCNQATAGATHNYASTCDGSPSLNGNGGGKATGKPCAGCVGAADNKNPKGQFPNGSDHNNGYECDGNKGIGKGNPAHTACTSPPPPPPCVGDECDPPPPCVGDECDPPPPCVGDECDPPEVDENPTIPDEVEGTVFSRTPRVLGAVLPFTGAPATLLIWAGLSLGLTGTGVLAMTGARGRRRH